MKEDLTGILLLNYGAPETMADIEPFLAGIFAGRQVLPAVLAGVSRRYQTIGGGSPLLQNTRIQAQAMETLLNREGANFRVQAAMLHTPPFIGDVVQQMGTLGVARIIAVSLAPFFSRNSTGAYFGAAEKACLEKALPVSFVPSWHLHAGFIQAVQGVIAGSLKGVRPEQTELIFSAHSLPQGEDAYVYQAQFLAAVQAVMDQFPEQSYRIAYQSKGGGSTEWLGPSLEAVFASLSAEGKKAVLVVPIGFVSDHLETLYDLDQAAAGQARTLGLNFRRCPALNDHPLFIKALADVVENHLRNEKLS